MSFRRNEFFHRLLMILFAIAAFQGAALAQFTVSLGVPTPTPATAPTGSFTVSATISGNTNAITKVVFYRNDIALLTDTTSLYQLPQDQLGQDTYTYRARAYDSTGVWVDSSDFKRIVNNPLVFKMGSLIDDVKPNIQTHGPDRTTDHTSDIREALAYLARHGGGTLFFPGKIPNYPFYPYASQGIAVFNIKDTINVPANVTLQGESAEDFGRARIYWIDALNQGGACHDNPGTLTQKPMFRIKGGASHVRFKDLWLWSLSAGIDCWPRGDSERIAVENTNAIEMNNLDYSGHIKDVILENVCIENFTYGLKAISNNSAEDEISDIKIRAFRGTGNHRNIFINAKYAYNWDVQNLNAFLLGTQGAVEIVNAGRPTTATNGNTKLKFLQVNCGGDRRFPSAFCTQVEKHGGLYFRQLHHEGVNQAIIVKDISGSTTTATTNPDPIVFESSVATGTCRDASMKLYLIGNAVFAAPEIADPRLDTGRLRFIGQGVNSTVIDCGDPHFDVTNTNPNNQGPYQMDPEPPILWTDLGMYSTHVERNRASFFAEDASGNKFFKTHTICPQGVAGLPNINEVGGEYFDSGLLPTEAGTYSNVLSTACPAPCTDASGALQTLFAQGGTVYIDGPYTLQHTVTIPNGAQIVGNGPSSQLTLNSTDANLFLINAPSSASGLMRTSGIVIRDVKLITTGTGKTGIAIVGGADDVGVSSDLHFSGLTIQGFVIGLDVRPTVISPMGPQPMVDGLSFKNITFTDNQTAVRSLSANASNWNVMNLSMSSSSVNDALGWDQKGGGHQSMQNLTCQGAQSRPLLHCIRLSNTGTYLAGLKKTAYVTNALTIWESIFTHLVVRDSDFRYTPFTSSAVVNLLGRAFITSMNNKYDNFNVDSPYSTDYLWRGDYTRLTYCGDTYSGGVYTGTSSGLATRHPNLITGAPTLTRVPCGTRPIPWDDAIRLGGTSVDKPLVGNFYADVREDFVIYREGTTSVPQSKFLIKQAGGVGAAEINWGLKDDKPMIGRFFPDSRAQIVIWRPSTGDFWAYDPKMAAPSTATYYAWHWGQNGDIPFVGNFFDESSSGNSDEVAVYRPSDKTFYIYNPRSTEWWARTTTYDNDSKIQVGDFLGVGYDQIAQVKAGYWKILDPRNPTIPYSAYLAPQTGDIPVAGKYLSGACTQIAVWRPTVQPGSPEPDRSEFIVADPFASCGTRSATMVWGSNNEFNSTGQYADDIPLTINTTDGSLRRPTAYRPTTGAWPYSISNGQWWVHDPF